MSEPITFGSVCSGIEAASVAWSVAETLGDRVIAKLDAMKDET